LLSMNSQTTNRKQRTYYLKIIQLQSILFQMIKN